MIKTIGLVFDGFFLQVVAVAARSLKSAQDFKDKFGLDETKAYEGYQALADDSEVSNSICLFLLC